VEIVASLSQGRTAAAKCGLFTYKSVPVIFEPPCISKSFGFRNFHITSTSINIIDGKRCAFIAFMNVD